MVLDGPREGDEQIKVKGLHFLMDQEVARNVKRYRGIRIERQPGLWGGNLYVVPTYGGCC